MNRRFVTPQDLNHLNVFTSMYLQSLNQNTYRVRPRHKNVSLFIQKISIYSFNYWHKLSTNSLKTFSMNLSSNSREILMMLDQKNQSRIRLQKTKPNIQTTNLIANTKPMQKWKNDRKGNNQSHTEACSKISKRFVILSLYTAKTTTLITRKTHGKRSNTSFYIRFQFYVSFFFLTIFPKNVYRLYSRCCVQYMPRYTNFSTAWNMICMYCTTNNKVYGVYCEWLAAYI